MRVALLGSSANKTNVEVVTAWRALGIDVELVPSTEARRVRPGTLVIGRVDVLPTLNGVEPGLLELLWLERGGARVANTARTLLSCHDKLRAAAALHAAGLPHPRTWHIRGGELPVTSLPLVVKPRFGSWGQDVFCCRTHLEFTAVLREVRERAWFRRHGAVLQELLPSRREDIRVVIADDRVVGAVRRIAAPGEWRTNVALGGTIRPFDPPEDVRQLALAAARSVGASFAGVDVLVTPDGYVALELNGAVEFHPEYSVDGGDVYADAAVALGLLTELEEEILLAPTAPASS